jgi:hypothetical protein
MKKLLNNKANGMLALSLASIAVVVSIAFISNSSEEIKPISKQTTVAPPLKNVDIAFKNYAVDANRSSTIRYFKTGSVITIPDSAFVDSKGAIIKGKVDIKYREFHDVADFFVSGIPMTYDSAGEKYHFESAGMLELLAFQYGSPVYLNPAKKITVEMLSKQTEDKFNIYKFNPLQGNWSYVNKDKAIPIASEIKDTKETEKMLDVYNGKLTKLKRSEGELTSPLKSDQNKYHFDIEIDSVEFPEFTTYKGVSFEVDDSKTDFNPLYASTTWNDIKLAKGKSRGSYLMTLIKGRESVTFETLPVLEGKNYEQALDVYNGQLKVRKNKEAKLQRSIDSLFVALNNERLIQNDFVKANLYAVSDAYKTEAMVKRVFQISGFGMWNSDCPSSLPKGELFVATYQDSLGNKLTFNTVYLVEKGRNAMFSIYSQASVSFNPKKKNCLWAVTADNKIAVFEEADFKNIKIEGGKSTLSMKIINKPIKTEKDVRKVLNI